jgi:hypothetical protein
MRRPALHGGGVVLGLAGAAGVARFLSSMLFEISFVDPLTIISGVPPRDKSLNDWES